VYHDHKQGKTLTGVLEAVQKAELPSVSRRDMTSAIKRVCEMAGVAAVTVPAEARP
jgi:hypothetical protein